MNIKSQFSRTAMLIGGEAVERLNNARVAVFGLGGVGGALCEALARAGVGALTLIDGDTVSVTNINRQIIATHSTVGDEVGFQSILCSNFIRISLYKVSC